MWKTSLPFLSPPLANPLLAGEGSRFIFLAERGFDFPPSHPSLSPLKGEMILD
jgi:hypothetical protein